MFFLQKTRQKAVEKKAKKKSRPKKLGQKLQKFPSKTNITRRPKKDWDHNDSYNIDNDFCKLLYKLMTNFMKRQRRL